LVHDDHRRARGLATCVLSRRKGVRKLENDPGYADKVGHERAAWLCQAGESSLAVSHGHDVFKSRSKLQP
jgi:hypothetical protein